MSFSARFSGDSKNLREVCDDFHCVTSEALAVKSVEELQKSAAYLAVKYNDDINGAEILSEVENLKFQCSAIVEDVQSAASIDVLNAIHTSPPIQPIGLISPVDASLYLIFFPHQLFQSRSLFIILMLLVPINSCSLHIILY